MKIKRGDDSIGASNLARIGEFASVARYVFEQAEGKNLPRRCRTIAFK